MKAFPVIFALAASLAFSAVGFADSPEVHTAWMTTSRDGTYLFKMVPAEVKWENEKLSVKRQPFGVAYSLSQNGDLNEIWRAEGRYSPEGRISDDGKYLVCFGSSGSDCSDFTDIAIAFYDQGKLAKEYQVRNLIKDTKELGRSLSHYTWRPVRQTEPTGFVPGMSSHFHLVMADKTTYVFDVATGDIVSTGTDPAARSSVEVRREQEAEDARKGQELLERSPFRKEYEQQFVIRGAQAPGGIVSAGGIDGPVWTATLTPKIKLAHPAEVDVIFPIQGDHVEVAFKAQEISATLEKAFQHPFVAQHFKNHGATDLRMQVQGDRLHGDRRQLREFLKLAKGREPDDQEMKRWAYAIIARSPEVARSFYLNIQTGELIYQEGYQRPPVLVLLDAKGERVK